MILMVVITWCLVIQVQGGLKEDDEKFSKMFMDLIDPKQIEKHLMELAHTVHRAGTPESMNTVEYIRTQFVEFGLKPVEVEEYDVLLSYPNPEQPDEVTLLDTDGKEVVISDGRSPILEDSESTSKNADLKYLAFGKPGTAISKTLVYANYGRQEDFQHLLDQGVQISGSIVLMRYGWLWRGTKVKLAQQHGALAAILFSDPKDYHGENDKTENDTFPHNDHLPSNDVQRGTLMAEDNGDVLTPLLPAKDYVSRKTVDSVQSDQKLPAIPATVIGYGDALKLFHELEGLKAPNSWQGGLAVTYTLGGSFKTASKIKVTVGGHLERKKIRNIIGYIKGNMDPHRYILLGNHHDAWTYGAMDPSSGTAALLEMARSFSVMANEKNWNPWRTLVFCAWDAEEYGLIGSTEWVEQNLARLQSQAVAYINVDTAVTGQYAIFARGVPALKEAVYEAAKRTPNPNEAELKAGVKTVFDSWSRASKSDEPRVDTLVGSGSDYKAFLHYAGVPVMDLRYGSVDRSYPLYHTLHDTVFLVKHFTDPTFVYHQAVARVMGEFARLLADSPVIPFNLDDYAKDLATNFANFEKRISGTPFPFNVDLAPITSAMDAFKQASHLFQGKMRGLNADLVWSSDIEKRFTEIRMVNEKLLMLERFFIEPQGTPYRPSSRHTLYGPGVHDSYTGTLFPGIDAALEYSINKNIGKKESISQSDHERIVAEQISWVAHSLHNAADFLNREF